MSATQRDVKTRIGSVKNIQKITRAMEMVAAARLRRAEQRIEALRPYAGAIRRMTRQAAEAAGSRDLRACRSSRSTTARTRSRCCSSPATAASPARSTRRSSAPGCAPAASTRATGARSLYSAVGRRGVSTLTFRGKDPVGRYVGFTDRPSYADARAIAEDLIAAYVDGKADRVEIFYNGYISPLTQEVRRETLLPLQQATILEGARATRTRHRGRSRRRAPRARRVRARRRRRSSPGSSPTTSRSPSTARCWSPRRPSTAPA